MMPDVGIASPREANPGAPTVTGTEGVCLAMPVERTVRENFPVALRFLPPERRRGLLAVYRYARLVDDIGDEALPEQRSRLLDLVARDLDQIYAGQTPSLPSPCTIARLVHNPASPEHHTHTPV